MFVELGISTEDEPTTFSRDELVKYFGSLVRILMRFVLRWLTWEMIVVWTVSWDELTRGGDALEVAWLEPEEGHPGNAREYQARDRGYFEGAKGVDNQLEDEAECMIEAVHRPGTFENMLCLRV